MKICLLTPSFLPRIGGMETMVDRLAQRLVATGHGVLVLAKTPREAHDPLRVPYELARYPRSRSNVWLLGGLKRAILEQRRLFGFDVLHVQQAYPTGHVAMVLRGRLGCPVVITSHSGDVMAGSRYRRHWITRRRMIRALSAADAVTAMSADLKAILDQLTAGQARSTIIANGADEPEPPPPQVPPRLAALAETPFLLSLGRIHPKKGIDVLVKALGLVRHRLLARVVIAGDGPGRPELERGVSELGLEGKVTFAGTVRGQEKSWLLAHCRFFLQPSRMEGMPLTLLEALAYGRPVVGTRVSGIVELVEDGANGVLVPPEDPAALGEAIVSLLGRPSLDDMQAAALRTAKEHSWPAVAESYVRLYRQVLAGRPDW